MDTRELYPVLESVHYALTAIIRPSISADPIVKGLSDSDIDLLLFLPKLDSSTITPEILNNRFPYISTEHFLLSLNKLSNDSFLVQNPKNEFSISENGRKSIQYLEQKKSEILNGIAPLPVNDLMDLASRLKEITDSCFSVGTPPGKWCIQLARKSSPGSGSPVMSRIFQFITELTAFRDDAVLSVWKAYCVSGHAWDILTVLWLEHKIPITDLITKLERRGYSVEQTYRSIEELNKKGLVLTNVDEVRVSPFGAEVRKIAEDTIDRYYYTPWKYFSADYLSKVQQLLNQCHKNIPVLDEIFC